MEKSTSVGADGTDGTDVFLGEAFRLGFDDFTAFAPGFIASG